MLIETAYEKHRFMLCRWNVHQHAGAKDERCRPEKGVDVTIKAVPVAEFEENIATADIVLLGPQVKYEQAKLQAIADPLGKKGRRYRHDGLRHDERRCGTGQGAETTGVMVWKS